MRLLIVLFFFFAVVSNELVINILLVQDIEHSLCENPIEQQSEKENKDSIEDESKIEHLNGKNVSFGFQNNDQNSTSNTNQFPHLTPYLEIHSPPPELV